MKRFTYYILLCFGILFFVSSCSLKKQISVNGQYEPTVGKIALIQTNQYVPSNTYRIGSIVVGESGFTPEIVLMKHVCKQ